MSISPEFAQLCDEYRPLSKAFAETVDQRLNQSYLGSSPVTFLAPDDTLEQIGVLKTKMRNSIGGDLKLLLQNFVSHKANFESFLRHFNKHVSSNYVPDFNAFKCDSPQMFNSSDFDDDEYLLFHVYMILACRCYLIYKYVKPEWRVLRTFVQDVTTRSYRLPRTARYIHAAKELLEHYNIPATKIDNQDYKLLLQAIQSSW